MEEKPRRVERMFSRLVARYDLMNTLITGGRDRSWRRLAVQTAEPRGRAVLEVGTGTAEMALESLRQGARTVVGLDFSLEMLRAAKGKSGGMGPGRAPLFLAGDALSLPFADECFDGVISGFVVRNLADIRRGFEEMRRVVRPGGRVVCLEMTHPRPGAFAHLYRLYFYRLVPLLGGLVAGNYADYRYLPNSLTVSPKAGALARIMEEAGLQGVRYRMLACGTVAIHCGVRG